MDPVFANPNSVDNAVNKKVHHLSALVKERISSVVIFTVAMPRNFANLWVAAFFPFLYTKYTRPSSSTKSISVAGVITIFSRIC